MGQQVNVYKELKFQPGARVSGAWNGSFDTGGRTYYVNNITGSANATGLSWNAAFDQLDNAITASEAYRALGGRKSSVTTNDYIRNKIILQGTGTTYEPVSALPICCDVIGLGAVPYGNGEGIVVIGDSDGNYDGIAGELMGSNFYNIQIIASGTKYAVDLDVAYRCSFDTCAFGSNSVVASNPAVAFNSTSSSGLIMRDCKTLNHHATPVIGYRFANDGGNFNECLIERCYALATTTGYMNKGLLSQGTIVRECVFWGGSTGLTDAGVAADVTHSAFYYHNFASGGTTGMVMTSNPERHCMNNYSVSNYTSAVYYTLA